jgi:glycosyltransferase involved in cell wall biosynthesis
MVGISLLTLVPGAVGGSETYARELTRALARHGELEYRVLVPSLAPDAGGGLPSEVSNEYRASRATAGRLRAMAQAAVRPGPLRRRLNGASVVHFPLTVPVPRVHVPSVITLLDVQHLDLPQLFSRQERAFRTLAYDRTAKRAAQVVVISHFVRERAVERLSLDPERVHAIHLGVDSERFRPDADTVREPYLLYPARPWPHKNHERLLAAYAALRRERPELRLVLTGGGHEGRGAVAGVELRGNVSADELVALYRSASCLVFPSLYEGFGLPPLEAMACGCPVAASDRGSLREVCGDAAVFFDPLDPDAIAAGIVEALDHADELALRGLERARRFTWERAARAHEDVYRAVAAG